MSKHCIGGMLKNKKIKNWAHEDVEYFGHFMRQEKYEWECLIFLEILFPWILFYNLILLIILIQITMIYALIRIFNTSEQQI